MNVYQVIFNVYFVFVLGNVDSRYSEMVFFFLFLVFHIDKWILNPGDLSGSFFRVQKASR